MQNTAVDIITERREIWKSKEIIRRLYCQWYKLIAESLIPGNTLELGGGSGNLKEFFPDTISSDIIFVSWLDAVLDAQNLPFRNKSLDNIVLFDVLHHLFEPSHFFCEAERVLNTHGRIVLMEPYVSWASFITYQYLHTEGMNRFVDPFQSGNFKRGKDPFHGNQAIPSLIFGKYRKRFLKSFPGLKVIREERMDTLIYPLSGGFHNPNLCPLIMWPIFRFIENLIKPLNRFLAFRIFLVLEKNNPIK